VAVLRGDDNAKSYCEKRKELSRKTCQAVVLHSRIEQNAERDQGYEGKKEKASTGEWRRPG
jgi:hypothetical protein